MSNNSWVFLGQGRRLGWLNVRKVKSFAEFNNNLGVEGVALKLQRFFERVAPTFSD